MRLVLSTMIIGLTACVGGDLAPGLDGGSLPGQGDNGGSNGGIVGECTLENDSA